MYNQVDALSHKIKHYLITMMGVTIDEATDEEFYRAFSLSLREVIMSNWTATLHTWNAARPRTLYFLCMEYMPGRLLENNISNMHAGALVKGVLQMLGRDYLRTIRIEHDPGLGNGGLGRLASCLLDSLATQCYPAIAYGLRYQYGIFDQEIWEGQQVERPDLWLQLENPWEFRRDMRAQTVTYSDQEVRALAYDIPIIGYSETDDFNVVPLRLWTTKESPRNFELQRYNAGLLDQAAENTMLTDVLYPNDNNEMGKRVRLKQEFLLVSASVQDIMARYRRAYSDISHFADKVRISINDTHPALVIAELMHLLMRDWSVGWQESLELVRTVCNYTNHSILRESLEEWNEQRVAALLPTHYRIIQRLNEEFCQGIRQRYPGDEERVRRLSIIEGGQIRMAHLAALGSHRVNGVSQIHTDILKQQIFKDFYELFPDKFVNVTNGMTQRRWLYHSNPHLAQFLMHRIGKGWITDFKEIAKLERFADDPESQKEFLAIKKTCKQALISYLKNYNPERSREGDIIGHSNPLGDDALFDVQIKRFHEYKRQLLSALHALMLYQELKADPSARKIKRMLIYAGKAAPGYAMAKNIIRLIYCLARKINNDPAVSPFLRIMFIENYNVSLAEKIIPAADLSEQISCPGTEASGTSNMKLAVNGALTIGTEDGANIEMHRDIGDAWWPFGFDSGKPSELPNALIDRSLVQDEEEHLALSAIYDSLKTDRYLVLQDLMSYYEAQKRVEALYAQPLLWAQTALHNMARMGSFSTDESIHAYAKEIWGLEPCPVNLAELSRVRGQFNDHF